MNNSEFYRTIVDQGVYGIFNGLRDALFKKLASDSHLPIAYSKLEEVIDECEFIHQSQVALIKDNIIEGERFRFHTCMANGLQLYYFVNLSRGVTESDEAAVHLQERFEVPNKKVVGTSAVVLFENHPLVNHSLRYPKIIKHELAHAAIEFVIADNEPLNEFYFSDDEKTKKFVELVCNIIPYLANPSKKENGINKFIDESQEYFGYDTENGELAEFIADINAASSIISTSEEDVTTTEEGTESQ